MWFVFFFLLYIEKNCYFVLIKDIGFIFIQSKAKKMENNQVKLLKALAKSIRAEKKDRTKILTSLQSAKILTKNENFTGTYSNLKRVVSTK